MFKTYKEGVCIDLKDYQKKKGKNTSRYFDLDKENPLYDTTIEIGENSFFKDKNIESSDYRSFSGYRCFTHGMVEAVHLAFCNHNGVEISPDQIWLLICQAISAHEEKTGILGKVFDLPNPKKKISIRADDFAKGFAGNDWPRVFGQFEDGIKDNVPETLYNLVSSKKYSTTTPLEQICFTICLMDSLKKYFDYEIYLKGKQEDWERLYSNTYALSTSGLEMGNWFPLILEILDEFVNVYKTKTINNTHFWNSIYKYNGSSGSGSHPFITGWIAAFFPYCDRNGWFRASWFGSKEITLKDFLKKSNKGGRRRMRGFGIFNTGLIRIDTRRVPNGVNVVPFVWDYLGKKFDYNFYGGFLGLEQDKDTGVIMPRMGWAVGEKVKEKKNRRRRGFY